MIQRGGQVVIQDSDVGKCSASHHQAGDSKHDSVRYADFIPMTMRFMTVWSHGDTRVSSKLKTTVLTLTDPTEPTAQKTLIVGSRATNSNIR